MDRGRAAGEMMAQRICTKCKVVKEMGCFYRHPTGYLGRSSRCKKCHIEYSVKRKQRFRKRKKLLDGYRACGSCKEVKILQMFRKNASLPLGRGYECRVCFNKIQKTRRQNQRHLLSDEYVLHTLTNSDRLKASDIPLQIKKSLIGAQRANLSLKRALLNRRNLNV